ncbi:hypothetical protein [Mycobacterium sp. ITM-2016-00318]|uniref:hypothetical protein n=1 Tax=Mycobacterium sp. ITM-2016-00318 TaxID=2099693 RepID=UPI00268B6201|nr:hypothetical protein [Mycobacterium sp. ITM-2016-00318]WNG95109.1 hypothetical protein C6A82_012110 [Mycobacterium sp. ITM-2016-00318]
MFQGIRPLVTTGVALVGASVIAVSPVTVPPPEIQAASLPAAQRVVEMSDVQLTGLVEDLERFLDAAINAPRNAVWGVGQALDGLPEALGDAASTREAVGVLAEAIGTVYASPIRAFLDPLIVNASPYDPAQQDFIDATLLVIRDLADDPLFLPTIPVSFLNYWGNLGLTPLQSAGLIAAGYLLKPFSLAGPFVAALANSLPAPFGGDLTSSDPADWGLISNAFDEVLQGAQNLIVGILIPDLMAGNMAAGVAAAAAPEDTWPPNAETAQQVLRNTGRTILRLPELLGNLAVDDVRRVGAYLERGRPLDAVRLLASHVLAVPTELASIPVNLGSTFLPPPAGDLLADGYSKAYAAVSSIAGRIGPQPSTTLTQKQVTASGNVASEGSTGNVVQLSLPRGNFDEVTNIGVTKSADPNNGNPVTKLDNRPKVGGNVRAVVNDVRTEVRQTIKDVRQGVRDVVKAVTGVGKKKDVKAESNEPSKPAE